MGTETVASRVARIQDRMQAALQRAGRRDEVTLVAVSKTFPAELIVEAYQCGVRHFGENRVQEFEGKRSPLSLPNASFHLVGHLQTNKVRKAVDLFDRIDSVDSLELAERLGRVACEEGEVLPVLLQVRLGGEESKYGMGPESALELARQVAEIDGLSIEGLMAVPPYLENAEEVRPFFRQLHRLAGEIERKNFPGVSMATLSMGMTHDFEVAIEEGATEIRVGTAIFGPRAPKGKG